MKKRAILLLITLLLMACSTSYALDINFSSLSFDELVELNNMLFREIHTRPESKEISVPIGVYEVGVHIPAGEYTISTSNYATITVTTTEDVSDYSSMITIDFITNEEPLGRLNLKDGTFVYIENYSVIFTKFSGLGF